MKQIKQLDSLRGLAVILVVAYHWLPDVLFSTYPNKPFDVDFFFVLSGFLITYILFLSRSKGEELNISKGLIFINFFIRRGLRIFPAYFLTVFIIIIFHVTKIIPSTIKQELVPCLTYTVNFYLFKMKYWPDLTTHFWTLAVEEQYYLIWPWVILLVNRKYFLHAIFIFIAIGVISQSFIKDMDFGYLPTYTCFDSFGLGALISWITIFKPQYIRKMFLVFQVLAFISFFTFLFVIIFNHSFFIPQQRFLRSLMASFVISYIMYKGDTDKMNFSFIFNNRFIIFLGKISYGIYLYHVFLPWNETFLDAHINKYLPSSFHNYMEYIYFIENIGILILAAWLSYTYFEQPVLSLKKYFRYKKGELTQLKKQTATT